MHVIGNFRRGSANQFEQRIWQLAHKSEDSVRLGRSSVNRWGEAPDEPVFQITCGSRGSSPHFFQADVAFRFTAGLIKP
jgi:hypothetical protein